MDWKPVGLMDIAHRDLDLQLVWRGKQMGLCDRVFQWHRLLPSSVPNTKTGNREGAWDWIGKTNVGQGDLQVAPCTLISPPLLRFLPIPTSFRENPLWFFIARCKGLRKGSFVEAELEFFASCRSRHLIPRSVFSYEAFPFVFYFESLPYFLLCFFLNR